MRVFPDTNVLASAFGTRGLCADVLRLILADYELATGEVVIEELRKVLRNKFELTATTVNEVEAFLRGYHVEPKPRKLPILKLRDRNDVLVVNSAVNSKAAILITGDQEILDLAEKPQGLQIQNPREFWTTAGKQKSRRK
ncbi:MAG: putative toxin-antitoxin system toxin component, PIN family [Deltaproteobacteria bacterium]|nr:putative toxin-antitoxin system toxin component, PIN family [Deltaproteobacteria bacterium]